MMVLDFLLVLLLMAIFDLFILCMNGCLFFSDSVVIKHDDEKAVFVYYLTFFIQAIVIFMITFILNGKMLELLVQDIVLIFNIQIEFGLIVGFGIICANLLALFFFSLKLYRYINSLSFKNENKKVRQ